MSAPLAAVFIGSDTLLLQCLELWQERGHEVTAVATDTDKVRRYCADHGLRCVAADDRLASVLEGERCDYLFAITWLQLLPAAVLALPQRLAINFHDGPLPRFAGLNATCWALLHGEQQHAVTWHVIDQTVDTGDILLQQPFAIADDDTALTLNARCFQSGQESFATLIGQLADGSVTRQPQDLQQRSCFGRNARPEALAVLDFTQPAAAVARVVRALDHGGYQNPLAIAKVRAQAGVFVPSGVELQAASGAAPGTVTAVAAEHVQVACGDREVRLLRPRGLSGMALDAAALAAMGVEAGAVLPAASADERERWTQLGQAAAPGEGRWVDVLRQPHALSVPDARPAMGGCEPREVACDVPGGDAASTAALCLLFALRNAGVLTADVGFASRQSLMRIDGSSEFAVATAPLVLQLDGDASVATALAAAQAAVAAADGRAPLLRDLVVRHADVLSPATVLEPAVRLTVDAELPVAAGSLTFAVAADGSVRLCYDAAVLAPERAAALAARLGVFARAAKGNPQQRLVSVPTLAEQELERLLRTWNDTGSHQVAEPCVHRQFQQTARANPAHPALRLGDATLSYAELNAAAERLAGWLRGRGVAPGDRVGICTRRGFGMVTAVLATMRCGAAYVPLDPSYPKERLSFMAGDAELAALIVDRDSAASAPTAACPRIDLDADADDIAGAELLLEDDTDGEQLAYVIYTSGSTGRPKGVMVRHKNVTNFFCGMDVVLGRHEAGWQPGVWLAVTSLSFDISVLELLWTLCRGFTVVLYAGDDLKAAALPAAVRPVSFSMFYFASDEGEHAEDKYRLLLDGARFADQHGFEAVWTPERHFHAFGGLYPNPAVASAAIAAITKNVHIRAGSCVATLHHPIRIAEDWSLVDNLSNGRVGIAFAAGWHGRDFVLRPENFADRKNEMFRIIDQVHALWRGEEVAFPGHDGKPQPIRTLPRPLQKRLPTWVTVAGNPETYRMAGESGSNVLTHLLGQSLDELKQKLQIYRDAWRQAGHQGEGHVTLMLHTFVGDDDDQVRDIVRGPMKEYLRSSLELVKQAAWSFPAFKNRVDKPGELDALLQGGLTPADFEALLDFSFERYYQQSGLFGTPDSCVAIVDRLRSIEVDEIACLVDFGVSTDLMMQSLPQLLELKRRCDTKAKAASSVVPDVAAAASQPVTIPQLIAQNGVTHLQCTPSMASMLLLDPAAEPALRSLRHMLVGGEALPDALAQQLATLVPKVLDVYGPTETTVWSTTMPVGDTVPVPIGRPLANQQVYVLDENLQPVPTGSAGELWIGGDGVTAGYFRRPELTAERFRPDPFVPGGSGAGDDRRIYGTGDLVRWRDDGVLEYLGRKDLQVKVRGYRIELGEIEAALGQHALVREAVVVARRDAGDVGDARLVAYYVPRQNKPKVDELRQHLRASLPEFMVPQHFVPMAELPRTPNLKVDRKALPAPEEVAEAGARQVVAAKDDTEGAILAIWRQALGNEDVGVEDNFFDSGGHSILAVKVHRDIVQKLGVELQVTDLFRFTTVRALAKHLQVGKSAPTAAQQATERAKQRRENLLRRR